MAGSLRSTVAVVTLAISVSAATIVGATELQVWLPNGWYLSPVSGNSRTVGTMPSGLTLSPDGTQAAFIENGVAAPALHVIDAQSFVDRYRLVMHGISGRPLWDVDGRGLWVGTGADSSIVHVTFGSATAKIDRTIALPAKQFWAESIARNPVSGQLAVTGLSANGVALTDDAATHVVHVVRVGNHPSQLAWRSDGNALYVAIWGERSIAEIDPAVARVIRTIGVGLHPEALLLTKDDRRLYVANTDDDTVMRIDTATDRVVETLRLTLFGSQLVGLSPSALAFSADERRLYVVCSAANAIAVLALEPTTTMLGALPTGWYPTDVAIEAHRLIVVNGFGEGSHANPMYRPWSTPLTVSTGYIGYNLLGSVRSIAEPSVTEIAAATQRVVGNASPALLGAVHDRKIALRGPAPRNPAEAQGRALLLGGRISHVFYIIKENRTYDQVLGDMPSGDGDPALTVFGAKVTPNEHALATRFGLFDHTFTDSQVSQNGHVWLTAAFANDYLQKTWPPMYGERFDEQNADDSYETHSGYLWKAAALAHLSYRSYGEYCDPDPAHPGLYKADDPGLVGHIDPHFPSFDLKISDTVRVAEWRREFAGYEKNGDLPSLTWMWLMNDHTAATRIGMRTPRAMVADNDLAVGEVVDTISHSRYWKSTAIFIIEDDAQNGPDHVDEQRTTLYVISPYASGGVHREQYTQNSVTRTVELVLGLPPLSTYDAGATPLYAAFRAKADLRPYDALPAEIDLNEVNARTAYGASESARMDLSRADRAPAALMSVIVQRASR